MSRWYIVSFRGSNFLWSSDPKRLWVPYLGKLNDFLKALLSRDLINWSLYGDQVVRLDLAALWPRVVNSFLNVRDRKCRTEKLYLKFPRNIDVFLSFKCGPPYFSKGCPYLQQPHIGKVTIITCKVVWDRRFPDTPKSWCGISRYGNSMVSNKEAKLFRNLEFQSIYTISGFLVGGFFNYLFWRTTKK